MFDVTGNDIYYDGVIVARLRMDKGASATNIADATEALRNFEPDQVYTGADMDENGDKRYSEGFEEGLAERALDTKRNSK